MMERKGPVSNLALAHIHSISILQILFLLLHAMRFAIALNFYILLYVLNEAQQRMMTS